MVYLVGKHNDEGEAMTTNEKFEIRPVSPTESELRIKLNKHQTQVITLTNEELHELRYQIFRNVP